VGNAHHVSKARLRESPPARALIAIDVLCSLLMVLFADKYSFFVSVELKKLTSHVQNLSFELKT